MQLNQTNFLRWNDFTPDTNQPYLPRPYERDRGACPYMPVAYPTEACSFYINSFTGLTLADLGVSSFAGLRLDLVNAVNGGAITAVAPLQQHVLDTDHFNIYATVVFPFLPSGQYYFRITKISDGTALLFSNNVLVRLDKANLDRETVFVRFRHDRFFYGIRYQELIGFYQQFRIHLNQLEEQFESDKESYRAVTTGKNRVFQNYLNKYHKIEAYWMDREAAEALAVAVEHDYFEVNGRRYMLKTGLKISNNPLSKYAKIDFEVWDEDFASVNRC